MKKELGKISVIRLGYGGYDNAMFGFNFTLEGRGWGVQDFWGTWTNFPEGGKYTEEAWVQSHSDTYFKIIDLMRAAKVWDLYQLQGIPVEVTFENMVLKSWRILTEVL